MGSPMVYDFNAFSKLKTIVKHSLQINFIFPGAPGWCVHAADALIHAKGSVTLLLQLGSKSHVDAATRDKD